MLFIGDGSWRATGNEFLRFFIRLGGLRPHHHVLDVGCGIGRMAMPLTRYLSPRGSYHGFDIVPAGIDWSTQHISSHFPNFTFELANIRNEHYNPNGTQSASEFVFPYASGTFDFVFLTSVFTHMVPADFEQYLGQISRVIRSGGRALITFFLINDVASGSIRRGKSVLGFTPHANHFFVMDQKDPEAAVAFDERYIRSTMANYGLTLLEPIHYGSWSGRKRFLSFQDIIVVEKSNQPT